MARLQTVIETLNLSDGERQHKTGHLRAVEPVDSSPQAVARGNLYVLLEIEGDRPASPRLYRLLLNTVQGVFYDAAGGIREVLTEAILAAHQALAQQNAVHPDDQQLAGISCVVLRGEELFLGVGGPAMVLVGHPGRVEQFPGELSVNVNPLGSDEPPAVEVFRTNVVDEATIVQLQSAWVARVPSRKLAATALAPDVDAALEYLESIAPATGTLSAAVIRVTTPELVEEMTVGEAIAVSALPTEASEEVVLTETEAASLDEEDGAEVDESDRPVAVETGERGQAAEGDEEEEGKRRPWLWLLAVLIPLAIVVIAAGLIWWQQYNLNLEYTALIQGAQAALEAAGADGVPEDTARAQLTDAQERVREAMNLRPDDPQARELQASIAGTLDEINRVTPLYGLLTLQELGGAGSDPARVVVQGGRVFILDQGLDTVVRYGLDEISRLIPESDTTMVAQRGQSLPDGQVVGELLDVSWAEAGGARRTSNLLIMDSNANLLEADEATGLTPLAVAGRDQWQEPRLISNYIGNFYLLDSGSGRVLRYLPSEDGYNNAPQGYFENDATLDLSLATDMDIDGNIWLLYRNGTVQTFFQGRQQPLEFEAPPNGAITQPQAMYVGSEAGEAQTLYIADSGQGRILEYDKEGNYLRQFRPVDPADQEKLFKMRDLHVDEIDGIFYILTTEGLLRADIP